MRRLFLLLLLVGASLALAGSAGATIVPQQGMAGVRLGMTQGQVKGILGTPLHIVRGSNDFGSYTQFRYPHLVVVTFQGNRTVTAIETTGTFERTATGLGVGSTKNAVKAKLKGEHCESFSGGSICYLGRQNPGDRGTVFFFRNGRVIRVTVGFVID